jgi:hypothetical protein
VPGELILGKGDSRFRDGNCRFREPDRFGGIAQLHLFELELFDLEGGGQLREPILGRLQVLVGDGGGLFQVVESVDLPLLTEEARLGGGKGLLLLTELEGEIGGRPLCLLEMDSRFGQRGFGLLDLLLGDVALKPNQWLVGLNGLTLFDKHLGNFADRRDRQRNRSSVDVHQSEAHHACRLAQCVRG